MPIHSVDERPQPAFDGARIGWIALCFALAFVLGACTTVQEPVPEPPAPLVADESTSIVAALESDGRFATFLEAADREGLIGPLSSDGPFSIFVPLNQQSPDGQYVVAGHVAPGTVRLADLDAVFGRLVMVDGSAVAVDGADGIVLGSGSRVLQSDIVVSNGVIHLIDRPISP